MKFCVFVAFLHSLTLLKVKTLAFVNFRSATNILEECYELLYLVSTACEAGVMALVNSGGLRVIAPQMSGLPDGNFFIPFLCIVCPCI